MTLTPRRLQEHRVPFSGYLAIGGIVLFSLGSLLHRAGITVVLPFMVVASALWIAAALRATGCDSPIARFAVYGAFAFRWLLAIVLYCSSLYQWPVMRSLQAGNGFWQFSMDAFHYHEWAPAIATVLDWGLILPDLGVTIDYYLVVATIYRVFGFSPLTVIGLNILAWTLATVFLVWLFGELRQRALPAGLVVILSFWPSGLIWPTQVMKDAPTVLCVILTTAAVVVLIRACDFRSVMIAAGALCLVLVPLVRLRIYDGRIICAGAVVAGIGGALALRYGPSKAWKHVALAFLAAFVVSAGVAIISAPDPYVIFAPRDPVAAYRRYAQALEARGDFAAARAAYEKALELDKEKTLAPVIRQPYVETRDWITRVIARLERSVIATLQSMTPDQLGIIRDRYLLTGGGSGLSGESGLQGWGDLLRLVPASLVRGLLEPLPWDILRPRGITGQFRTLAISESIATLLLLPAIALGMTRLRRTDEFFVAAVAWGGLLSLSLVVTNLGTLFRLRAVFALMIVAFASYGLDAYPRLWKVLKMRKPVVVR